MNGALISRILLVMLAVSIVGTPVTYRGGSAAPHPHMFLQLWHDSGTGDFTHHAPRISNHIHGDNVHSVIPTPLPRLEIDEPHLTVSAFVVSDWGVSVLNTPASPPSSAEQTGFRFRLLKHMDPQGRTPSPEAPPPRTEPFE